MVNTPKQDNQTEEQFNIIDILLETIPFVFCKDINGVYQGGNFNQAKTFGFFNPSEFIGKTIYDILDDAESAKLIDETDREIMQKDNCTMVEETISTPDGIRSYLSQKQPIHSKDGRVIGMLGFAMDITEIKANQQKAEAEKERLEKEKYQIELDHYKKLTQQQAEFQEIARQVAHDIVSPLSAFSTILSMLKDIPEKHRITLKQAAARIEDITNDLLNQYKKQVRLPETPSEDEIFFTYLGLRDILSEKRVEYHALPISFTQEIEPGAYFAFIKVNSKSFQRMLSNLINNAVDALEGKAGVVHVKLSTQNDTVVINITDNGKGMSPDIQNKILQGISITDGKSQGHGIGFSQVHDTLLQSNGTLAIHSNEGSGTEIVLTFPKTHAPKWAATELIFNADQTVLILDDDPFIHGAWEARFAQILVTHPDIRVIHFTKGNELLNFLAPLNQKEISQFYLLSDYELINQEMNGLQIISKAKINKATLVTSHYASPEVLTVAGALKIPVLPKRLASKVPIQVIAPAPEISLSPNPSPLKKTDIVLLDDNQIFADSIIFRLAHRKVTHFLDPRVFLKECENYAKDTPICIDNQFDTEVEVDGLDVAAQLHALGFTRLFLVSGGYFEPEALPDYVTLIKKMNLEALDLL